MSQSQLRPGGFEPPTDGLEIRCSIQLSYGRVNFLSELTETRSCVVRLAIPN